MNNLNLQDYRIVKLSLSVLILMSVTAVSKADTRYGPIKAGETLSSIVNENYIVSPFEDKLIMEEIFRLNPEAFIANNIGLVRQGVVLTLPSDDTIRRSTSSLDTEVITSSLNETLTQVKKERDQAQLKLKQLESESNEKQSLLNDRIEQLALDNQSTAKQLSDTQTEMTQLKGSLERAKQENTLLASQLKSKPEGNNSNQDVAKALEESQRVIAEKQQQISQLELTVSELKSAANTVRDENIAAISALESSYKALEVKLAEQTQLNASDLTSTVAEPNPNIEELKFQHQQSLTELEANFQSEIAKSTAIQDSLKSELEKTKQQIGSVQTELTDLRQKNSALELALSTAKTSEVLELTNTDTFDALRKDPLNKDLIIQEIQKPVAFPFWGLLLGCFALGFTSLMLLFSRKRKQVVYTNEKTNVEAAENSELVFRSANLENRPSEDPELLRVPPRRDHSKTAIIDPTMVAAASSNPSSSFSGSANITGAAETVETEAGKDAKLKLLIADTYIQINNIPAANELLAEVQQEGDSIQIQAASDLLAKINQ